MSLKQRLAHIGLINAQAAISEDDSRKILALLNAGKRLHDATSEPDLDSVRAARNDLLNAIHQMEAES